MPARIYALAKELNLDSKDLVELVKKAGITGKGSALASLTDEETQRLRDHLASTTSPAAKSAAPPASVPLKPERTPIANRIGRDAAKRTIVLPKSAPSSSAKTTSPPNASSPVTAEGPAKVNPAPPSSPAAATPSAVSVSPTPASRTAPRSAPLSIPGKDAATASTSVGIGMSAPETTKRAEPTADATTDRPDTGRGDTGRGDTGRGDTGRGGPQRPTAPSMTNAPIAPLRRDPHTGNLGAGKMRSLDRPISGDAKRSGGESKPRRRDPVINLASLPDAPQQPVSRASNDPPAQKPDIKLSRDVIAGHKQGMKAPLEQLAAEDTEKKARAKRVGAAGAAGGGGGLSGFTGDKAPRRKPGGEPEEDDKLRRGKGIAGIAGMASARAERGRGSKRRAQPGEMDRGGRDTPIRRRTLNRRGTNTAAPRKDKVVVELPCTIRSFSESAGVPVAQVLRILMGMQMMVNINSQLDISTAEMIATELGLDIELKQQETLEDELITQIEELQDDAESLVTRAPVVTFLGHVDHGKTSLLDYLIGINVAGGEAGGITQHIRAYEINKDGRQITFVDTPGHEAFTEMRARGANVTDIAVLVVAADDGIMPQTAEAISHAKAANVPIVVALNKIDLEGVDQNRILTQLTEHQLTPSEWGGDVEVVRTSATKGTGMDELLETLLTVAEMHEYTANPNRQALGVCLESEQQGDRGVIAKLIVQNGTLKVGDIIVCGDAHGRVRSMIDPLTRKPVKTAGPSTPVNVTGLDLAPAAGDRFHVLNDITQAREIAGNRADIISRENLSGNTTKISFENFQNMLAEGRIGKAADRVKLNLIIRADVRGSLEAIEKELSKFDHPEVELRILQKSVGGVSLADVTLASASDAVILAFNVIPDDKARSLAEERNIEIRRYSVIYKLADEIKLMIEGRLKPEERVVELGRALVKQVFQISRMGTIAGCYVAQGVIQRGCRIRVNRDSRTIGDYALDSLRRIKEDVKEVPRGMECGIRLQSFNDIKQDDVLEAYKIEEVARKLEM